MRGYVAGEEVMQVLVRWYSRTDTDSYWLASTLTCK